MAVILHILHASDRGFVIEGPYPFITVLSMNHRVVVLHKQHPSYFQEKSLHGLCNTVPLYIGIRYEVKQTMYEQVNVSEQLKSDDPSKLYEVDSSEEAMECNLCKSKKAIDCWKVQNGQVGI